MLPAVCSMQKKMISDSVKLCIKPIVVISVRGPASACRSMDLSYLYKEQTKPKPPPGVEFFVYNRNPRNLERLRLAYRNEGWHLDNPGRTFWHKLSVRTTSRHISCAVEHVSETVPITASTSEPCFRKFLNSVSDRRACIMLARVFARRCLEAGINEVESFYKPVENGKVHLILQELEKNGLSLKEAGRIKFPNDHITKVRPEVPWEVIEE